MKLDKKTVMAAVVLTGIIGAIPFLSGLMRTGAPQGSTSMVPPDLASHPLYRTYEFNDSASTLRIGVQPLYFPTGLIMESMRRDSILREELAELGVRMEFFPFLKGQDVNFFLLRGDLDIGVGGDMPALVAGASQTVTIASVLQRGYTSVLSRRSRFVADLKGKSIGFPQGSNAHYALMKALEDEGLGLEDVELVPMEVTDMPQALQSRRVDAFSAWEPTVEVTLTTSPGTIVVSRTMSTVYLCISDHLIQERPAVVRLVLAAQVRAIRWMRRSRENLLRATEWSIQEAERFGGGSFPLSTPAAAALAEKDLMGITVDPVHSQGDLAANGRLATEYRFLRERSWIETDLTWDRIRERFDISMVMEVIRSPERFRLGEFLYLDGPS